MTSTLPAQTEFDWLIGHAKPWLHIFDVANGARLSMDHVPNLFAADGIDFVINIATRDSARPAYRIFRPSFDRFMRKRSFPALKIPATNFETEIHQYLRTKPAVLRSDDVAAHLDCTDRHVLNLGAEIAIDFSSPNATRSFWRSNQAKLIQFIIGRRVS